MTIDLARFLAIAGVIASALVTAILYLMKWIRELIDQERQRLLARAIAAEKERDETLDQVRDLEAKRLQDSKEYAQAMQSAAHRVVQAIRALTSWAPRRR